ncbi:MAG: hypothetical protein ABR506_05755, partial [Candidatus Krumholzibacteriia bacterium]
MRRAPIVLTLLAILASVSILAAVAAAVVPEHDVLPAVSGTLPRPLLLPLPDRSALAVEDEQLAAAGEPYRFALPEQVAWTTGNA